MILGLFSKQWGDCGTSAWLFCWLGPIQISHIQQTYPANCGYLIICKCLLKLICTDVIEVSFFFSSKGQQFPPLCVCLSLVVFLLCATSFALRPGFCLWEIGSYSKIKTWHSSKSFIYYFFKLYAFWTYLILCLWDIAITACGFGSLFLSGLVWCVILFLYLWIDGHHLWESEARVERDPSKPVSDT